MITLAFDNVPVSRVYSTLEHLCKEFPHVHEWLKPIEELVVINNKPVYRRHQICTIEVNNGTIEFNSIIIEPEKESKNVSH